MGAAFWYGTTIVLEGGMSPGTVFAVFWACLIGAMRVGQAVPQISAVIGAKMSAGEIFANIDRVSKRVLLYYNKMLNFESHVFYFFIFRNPNLTVPLKLVLNFHQFRAKLSLQTFISAIHLVQKSKSSMESASQ